MEIHFKDKKIKRLCEDPEICNKRYGSNCTRKLQARLNDLRAASNPTELHAGNPHLLTGDLKGLMALNLAGGLRLLFAPANDPCPKRPDGTTDWSCITIICIEDIRDYHD
ncbi:MAG: type II toxin-antitoxin system RelE/ParE family toxin [Sutterella sp.]|nr:type II toxin-antitoxin system RelE/ParE family toxin [Sutterella sp.]